MFDKESAALKLSSAGHLVEAILNEDRHFDSPRQLVLLRVKAGRATSAAELEDILKRSCALADSFKWNNWKDSLKWKDSLRSHFELAEFYFRAGNLAGCAHEISVLLFVLRRHFSSGNGPMAGLHRLRADCLRAGGCELGARFEDSLAEKMEKGGR